MTKPLRNIDNLRERERVMNRRLSAKEKGLGYWGAVEAKVVCARIALKHGHGIEKSSVCTNSQLRCPGCMFA